MKFKSAIILFSVFGLTISQAFSQTIPTAAQLGIMTDAQMETLMVSLIGGSISSASESDIISMLDQITGVAAITGDLAIIEHVSSLIAYNLILANVPAGIVSASVINSVIASVIGSGNIPSAEIIQAATDGFTSGLNRAALAMGLAQDEINELLNEASASALTAIAENPALDGLVPNIINIPDNVSYDG